MPAVQPLRMKSLEPPSPETLDPLLDAALAEDLGTGDVTSETLFEPTEHAAGRLLAKATGVLCGLDVFGRVFERLDAGVTVTALRSDGEALAPGEVVCELAGPARALLSGERTALNLIQRLSGIATATRRYVDAAPGTRILDTRKTTPCLRTLEKYAVRCGGGENHRFGLFDEAMVKDNHVDLSGVGTGELVRRLREVRGEELFVTAEARGEDEALAAIGAGADCVLLDNFTPEALAELVPRLRAAARGRARPLELEASGGVTLATVARFAESGVDRISVGALTHSPEALDLSLELWRAEGGAG